MKNYIKNLSRKDLVLLDIRKMYDSYGYKRISLPSFEEYDLYNENKDFIDSLERDEFSIISEELSYITNDLLKYIYDNWKIFRILILNDKTKIYKTFFNTIVENETKMTQLMIEKKNISQYEHLTLKKLKSLISAQYQGIFALMRTEDDIKNLDNDLHLLFDFFRYGWIGVLGI